MMAALAVIFWLSILLILHSYVFFPLLLSWLADNFRQNQEIFSPDAEDLPEVAILLAVYNEEKVIEEKIRSTFDTHYPAARITFYIGSDSSTDATDSLIRSYQEKFPQIKFQRFEARTGKTTIINSLERQASAPVLILTDANVFFEPDTIYQLVKHFKNPEIAVVGGNILNAQGRKSGIANQEKAYLQRENIIKYQEGKIWGAMIGAFGGCYAVRKTEFKPVPGNFIVDDFYISMQPLREGKKAINELDAICHEDVSDILTQEFRRKVRISMGNFQNLGQFKDLLWPPFTGVGFAFLSHKVIRWCTPFLLLLIFAANLMLLPMGWFYQLLFAGQLLLLALMLADLALKKVNIHIKLFRYITHFYSMNAALLLGWFKYLKGVKTSVWTPTQRFQ
jgi:cellulose synthase/poly-beta-1,6-N-acetylglucosamine synthase-like glycosyltransferase